eukprot:gene7347-8744_t
MSSGLYRIEPGTSIEREAEISIAVVPVGGLSPAKFKEYAKLLTAWNRIDLRDLRATYDSDNSNQGWRRSPFGKLPWEAGCLRFHFVEEAPQDSPSSAAALNARSNFAVIGICHCPATDDLRMAYQEFLALRAGSSRLNAPVMWCLAFEPTGAAHEQVELEVEQRREKLFVVPPLTHQLKMHVQTMMELLSCSVLSALEEQFRQTQVECARIEAALAPSLPDLARMPSERRRRGNALSLAQRLRLGRLCLLAGSPADAHDLFEAASVELSSLAEHRLQGQALEGVVAATLLEPGEDTQEDALRNQDAVREMFEQAMHASKAFKQKAEPFVTLYYGARDPSSILSKSSKATTPTSVPSSSAGSMDSSI